jgi:hypothetical protein
MELREIGSIEEIDAKMRELAERRRELEAVELEKRRTDEFEEAVKIFGLLVDQLRRLEEIGYLPVRLAEVLTDSTGKINPGLYLKRPRAPLPLERLVKQQLRSSEHDADIPASLELPPEHDGQSQAAASPKAVRLRRKTPGTRRKSQQ